MADPNPPRAPVFRCAECEAVWRTETQRDLCCKGEGVDADYLCTFCSRTWTQFRDDEPVCPDCRADGEDLVEIPTPR